MWNKIKLTIARVKTLATKMKAIAQVTLDFIDWLKKIANR